MIVLEGWRRSGLALAAGAVSALSLAPYHFYPVLLITLPVLVWLLDGAVGEANRHGQMRLFGKVWPAARIGWLFGFGYFLTGFWWVGKAFLVDMDDFGYLMPFAVVVLPAGLALFWMLGAVLSRLAWTNGWTRIVSLAAALTLVEWLRGTILSGLPWNVLGYAVMPTPVFMQSSALVGLYGMTFLAIFVSAMPAILGTSTEHDRATTSVRLPLVLAVLAALAHGTFGLLTLSTADSGHVDDIRLRIVQPALNQSEKWDSDKEQEIMAKYMELSNANKGPDHGSVNAFTHVIWPESAFPFILTERADQLAAIARLLPPTTSLITGAMRYEEAVNQDQQAKVYNSLYVLNGEGETVVARDKVRLVPFGEFLPFQTFLESLGLRQLTQLRGGFSPGNKRVVVDLPGTPTFLPLICYEIIYAGAIRGDSDPTAPQPKWIVNLTNDAWFGMTAGPYQHAHQARLRAVEEGIPVVRAANNGISFITDAYGRIEESLALGKRGTVDGPLPVARSATLYSKTGNTPVVLFVCLLLVSLLISARNRTHRM